ncbi:MAG: hypothetical protein FWB95_01655 [Treponema sp.]|nr:hypothetical protein [Treponema sp.]
MKKFAFLLIFFIFLAGVAQGAEYTWTGDGGDNTWENEANWLVGGSPADTDEIPGSDPSDTVIIDTNATITIANPVLLDSITIDPSFTLNLNSGSLTVNELTVNGSMIFNGSMIVTGTWTVGAPGTFAHSGGTVTFNSGAFVHSNNIFNNVICSGNVSFTGNNTFSSLTVNDNAVVSFADNSEQVIITGLTTREDSVLTAITKLARWKLITPAIINFNNVDTSTTISWCESDRFLGWFDGYTAINGNNNIGIFYESGTAIWTGSQGSAGQGLWNNNGNWLPASPVGNTSAIIIIPQTANHPVLDVNVECKSLTIESGAVLDLKGFDLSVATTITNSGEIELYGASNQVTYSSLLSDAASIIRYYNDTPGETAYWEFGGDYKNLIINNSVIMAANTGMDLIVSGAAELGSALNIKSAEITGAVTGTNINITAAGYIKLNGANNAAAVNLTGNGEISYNSVRTAVVTAVLTNNSSVTGETTITAAGKLIAHGITGGVVSLEAGEIEITADIDCRSLVLNAGTTGAVTINGSSNVITVSKGNNAADHNAVAAVYIIAGIFDGSGDIFLNSPNGLVCANIYNEIKYSGNVTGDRIHYHAPAGKNIIYATHGTNLSSYSNYLYIEADSVQLDEIDLSATGNVHIINITSGKGKANQRNVRFDTDGIINITGDYYSSGDLSLISTAGFNYNGSGIVITSGGKLSIDAAGNINLNQNHNITELNLKGSGNITYNSVSGSDVIVSINKTAAGGTTTLGAVEKLIINGITNGGTVNVNAKNIDITGAVTGGVVTLSAENINITAPVNCERFAVNASHTSGAVTIGALITASGSVDCGTSAAVYIMTWNFAGTGNINLTNGTGAVCVHQYDSPTYTGAVTGNRIHYHYHIPDNTHIVYRAGIDNGGFSLPVPGPYRYLRADDNLGANIAYSTYGSGNIYIFEIPASGGYENSRNLTFSTGVSGVIELLGDYYSTGNLNFYPGVNGDGVKISSENISLGGAFEVHGKITLDNDNIEITASKIILNEIIEGKNSLTINGPTTLYGGVSGIGELILNDNLILGSDVVINADYTELDEVDGYNHSLTINALPVSGHAELKNNINAIANLDINGNVILGGDVVITAATVKSGDIDADNNSLEINGSIISNVVNITNGKVIKLDGNNYAAAVNLNGNGEISYNSARTSEITANVTNNDNVTGETTINALRKLTVSGMSGGIVSLKAAEIEITADINCHSLTMNTTTAGITANASIVSDELAVSASGNINLAHDNDVPAVSISASGNIIYNSISASDVTMSINKTTAGGTSTITAAGKLIVDGITTGGTVNVTAQNIDLHSPITVNGSLALYSSDDIDINGAVGGSGSLTLNADTNADNNGDVNVSAPVNIGGIFNHYSGGNLNLAANITANAGVVFNNDVNSNIVVITANAGTININNKFNLNGTTTFASEVRLGSGEIEFGGDGAGDTVIFNVISGASSSIKITDADVRFNGNVSVNNVSVENVNAASVNTTINADITTAGNQLYQSAVDMNGNPILISLNGDIEFTRGDSADVINSIGSIIKLVSGNDIIINIPIVNAVQLSASAQNGKVSIYETHTTSNGVENEAASIFIFANEFEVLTTAADSIIPGSTGQLCLLLNNPVGWTDTDSVVDGDRWHQHIPIILPAGMHLVIYNSSVTDINDLELVFDPVYYHYQDSGTLNAGDLLTVGLGNNIYIYNVSNNDDSAPMLNLIAPGGGYIEFYEEYKSSGINLHAGTGGIRLKDADITITGSFNTNGASLILDGTENKITAGGIIINGGIRDSGALAVLTLNAAGNILMTSDIGTSAARLGDIIIEDGDVSFNTANPAYVKNYTQEEPASLVNTNTVEINVAENVEFKGSVNVTNALTIAGNVIFNAGVNAVNAGSLHVTENAEFKSTVVVANALTIAGNAVFSAGITAGSLHVSGTTEIGAVSTVTITTTAAAGQIYTGDVTLTGNVQFASGTQGDVELGLIHGGGHNLTSGYDLTINSANSAVMNGTGAGSDINILNITTNDKVSFNSSQLNAATLTVTGNSEINADIHTTGAQNFNGNVDFGSEQHTLTSTGSAITVPTAGKVSGTAGVVINASQGISMTNTANDLSGPVSLNNNQGTASGTVNFVTTGTITLTGENIGRQFNITASKIDSGFIKAANLTVISNLGIILSGDNEITSTVSLTNNGNPDTDSGIISFKNISTGNPTLAVSNNIGNIHITAAGDITTSAPINALKGVIELESSGDVNINHNISGIRLIISADTVTVAAAAGIVTEHHGEHGTDASIYINAGALILPASSMNIIPGLSGKICVTTVFTSNGRVAPDRICDHGIGIVPSQINIVYGDNPPQSIYTDGLYYRINSSDNIGTTVSYTVDPGFHIIIIDTKNNNYAANRTVTFKTSGASDNDYIEFRGDQTYHHSSTGDLTLVGNVIIAGKVNISNACVIQEENTSLTIEENASLKLVNGGSWLIGKGFAYPDGFTGIYGSLIMNNHSTLTAERFILEGDSASEKFVVNKLGAQRAAFELTGNVNIGDYVDYTGDYPLLYIHMAGSGTQSITTWNYIGSLQIEQNSETVLLSDLEIHGEVIINNPNSLDAGNFDIVLRAALTDTARYGNSAKLGRWRIVNGSIDTSAGASIILKKLNPGDTVFFEIIGNTVWKRFICHNELRTTIRFSAYPDKHKFIDEFSVMVDDSANPADRITITRYTDNVNWLYSYDNTSIVPPANGLPTAYEASQYNRFWNLTVSNANIVKFKHIRLFFSYTDTSIILDTVIDSIEAFPFYIAGAKSYFNHNWREDRPHIVYSFLEDADGNGRADRIRAQTSVVFDTNLSGSFDNFTVTVDGYTVKRYEFVIDTDYDSFYIVLNEEAHHSLYNGNPVTWQIKTNTTLKDKKGRLLGAQSGATYSSIPPRISYALTLPNHPQTVIQMSQSVGPNGLSPAYINSESVSGLKSLYPVISGLFSVEELENNPPVGDAPVTNAYFTMQGLWSSEDKLNIDPDYSPKYPLNWNYSGYSDIVSQTFVSPYRVLTPEMMKKLVEWNKNPIASNLVMPIDFENGGDLITRRSTDILVSRAPADANDNTYFIWPVWAKNSGQNNSSENTKTIYDFDGSEYLGSSAAVNLQSRINSSLSGDTEIFWSVNVPERFRNPGALPSRGKSGGLWIPDLSDSAGNTPLYFYAPSPDKNISRSTVADNGSLLFNHSLTANPPFASGSKVEFVYRLSGDSDMIVARLEIPRGSSSIPSDWYKLITPFSFDIQDVREQRGGVTILNNVINPVTGESTYIRYVLLRPGRVTIQVHTLDGSLVKSIRRNEHRDTGEYTESWDGTNNGGRPLARGIYFIRVVGPDIDEIRKVMVVR